MFKLTTQARDRGEGMSRENTEEHCRRTRQWHSHVKIVGRCYLELRRRCAATKWGGEGREERRQKSVTYRLSESIQMVATSISLQWSYLFNLKKGNICFLLFSFSQTKLTLAFVWCGFPFVPVFSMC